jgi:hypothetical protein
MRFKLSISRQAIFNDAKKDSPCSGKFIFTKPFCLFYIISIQTIYDYVYQKLHEMNGFVKLRSVSKLSTFFWHTLYYYFFIIYGKHHFQWNGWLWLAEKYRMYFKTKQQN